jgi:hypothetical protein
MATDAEDMARLLLERPAGLVGRSDDVTFHVTASMPVRWLPQFLGFLKAMQDNGAVGHSEVLGFFADGDGDFQPQFLIAGEQAAARPLADIGGNRPGDPLIAAAQEYMPPYNASIRMWDAG